MKKSKKAQMEIMGLIVIIMILAVAFLFIVFFIIKEKPEMQIKSFDTDLHAFNTISAAIQTDTPCRSLTILDIIKQCTWTNTWVGPECVPSSAYSNNPCGYATEQLEKALDASLDFVNQDYHFYVFREADIGTNNPYKIDISTSLCDEDVDTFSATQPISYQGGNLFIRLDICDQPIGEI